MRMVADVTETHNVIPSLEFKTWTTKKCFSFYCFEPFWILMIFYTHILLNSYTCFLELQNMYV